MKNVVVVLFFSTVLPASAFGITSDECYDAGGACLSGYELGYDEGLQSVAILWNSVGRSPSRIDELADLVKEAAPEQSSDSVSEEGCTVQGRVDAMSQRLEQIRSGSGLNSYSDPEPGPIRIVVPSDLRHE